MGNVHGIQELQWKVLQVWLRLEDKGCGWTKPCNRRTIMKGIVDSEQWDFLVGPILILRALLDAVTPLWWWTWIRLNVLVDVGFLGIVGWDCCNNNPFTTELKAHFYSIMMPQWLVHGGNALIKWRFSFAARPLILSLSCDDNGRFFKFSLPSGLYAALWIQYRIAQFVDDNFNRKLDIMNKSCWELKEHQHATSPIAFDRVSVDSSIGCPLHIGDTDYCCSR